MATVGDLADYLNGRAFKPTEWKENGKPIIRIQNLNDDGAKYNFSPEQHEDKYRVKNGDLLFAWSASLGAHIWHGGDAWLNQHIFNVHPKSCTTKPFVFYLLSKITAELYAKAHGSGMVHVTKGKFESTEVALPPINEQHRIVAKIEELFSELDKGIEALKTAREQLKVYRQALLKHAFEGKLTAAWRAANPDKLEPAAVLLARIQLDREQRYQQQLQQWQTHGGSLVPRAGKPKAPKPLPPLSAEELAELPELPEGWGWVRFGELAQSSQNGISKRNSETGKEFIVLRLADIVAQRISLDSPRVIRLSEEEIQNYALHKDELLCIRVNGSPDLVGRMVLVGDDEEAAFCDHFIRFKLVEGICSSVFLRYFFDTHSVRRYVELNKVSSAGQNTVNQEMLNSVVVAICGIEEQRAIVESLEQKFSEADLLDQTLATSLHQSEALRQSILKRAFAGALVPQDENDEPASELLERIRAEKVKPAPNAKSTRSKRNG